MVPERIGKYLIVRKSGRGGFGDVYEGWDSALGRNVAIKVLKPRDDEDRRRFEREARVIAALGPQLPVVAQIYDFFSDPTRDLHYLVEEFLSGVDLKTKIEEGDRLPGEVRLAYLDKIAYGLSEVHKRGVVHRDLKPGNVRVLHNHEIKLLDFGLAKVVGEDTLAEQHAGVGTPSYAAPEQSLDIGDHDGDLVEAPADVFSLGVIAYELLTVRRPYEAANWPQYFEQLRSASPPPVRTYWPDCPADLDAVIMTSMRREPSARPRLDEVRKVLRKSIRAARSLSMPPVASGLRDDTTARTVRGKWDAEAARAASVEGMLSPPPRQPDSAEPQSRGSELWRRAALVPWLVLTLVLGVILGVALGIGGRSLVADADHEPYGGPTAGSAASPVVGSAEVPAIPARSAVEPETDVPVEPFARVARVATRRDSPELTPPTPAPTAAPTASPTAGLTPALTPAPTPAAETPASDRDAACVGADDMPCLLRLQRRLAEARRVGDCRSALALAQRWVAEAPEFAASDPAAAELATLHFECALSEGAEGDPHDREELLLHRAVALASGEDGAGWCDAQRSRILAAAAGRLRDTASAAASARRARAICPESSTPVEWEFYLRLGLGQVGLAAEVADEARSGSGFGELGEFLRSWAQYAAGTCPDVERWVATARKAESVSLPLTPCTVLPDGACVRARSGWIRRCGSDAQLASYASELRRVLALAEDADDRSTIQELAEVEAARGESLAAAELFARLQEFSAAGAARRGLWSCRRGDALLHAGRLDEALEAFEQASISWQDLELSVSRTDRLVVENNALVLAGTRRGEVDAQRLAALHSRVESLADEAPLRPWRLAVENNLLELRTRAEAEQAEAGPATARDALERLRGIEADYRRHLQSVASIGGDEEVPRACSILVFAGESPDETNVESERETAAVESETVGAQE